MRTHKLFRVLVLGGAVLGTGCGAGNPADSTSTTGTSGGPSTSGGAGGGATTTPVRRPDGGTATASTTGHGSGVTGW
jgi:hypothetical protein